MFLGFFSILIGPPAAAQEWHGPTTGPAAAPGKRIVVVAENMRNDGIGGIVADLNEAAGVLQWHIVTLDAAGDEARLADALRISVSGDVGDGTAADGVVLAGLDAVRGMPDYGDAAQERALPLVGWHVGPRPGPVPSTPVAINVTTDPAAVARLAAKAAITRSNGRAGVVILTDYRYAIAVSKARGMANSIKACGQCTLLELVDVPLADTATRMPVEIARLMQQYGGELTDILAINDLYFDDATAELQREGIAPDRISLISAGDGSPSALDRIQRGYYQTATVAEPLALQAWQLLDELNRLMARQPVSGFVADPIVVTRTDPAPAVADFRTIYRRIWQR
ncbi:MAG TPA: substrate-binding domain-containing protein [Aliidongia sp.]|uniref:substrate-binding domain-containing protein n=1 Tax=Aliidongia sp. TaxID=1914230 RepID=UPI002DDCC42E|nr:substrate-binding domain-containing protein [Aliidongia sp.]HEV2678198.1 substrate-binding domain-containing protein [Aliidongia sp.]